MFIPHPRASLALSSNMCLMVIRVSRHLPEWTLRRKRTIQLPAEDKKAISLFWKVSFRWSVFWANVQDLVVNLQPTLRCATYCKQLYNSILYKIDYFQKMMQWKTTIFTLQCYHANSTSSQFITTKDRNTATISLMIKKIQNI